jgi:hypothetical protein
VATPPHGSATPAFDDDDRRLAVEIPERPAEGAATSVGSRVEAMAKGGNFYEY